MDARRAGAVTLNLLALVFRVCAVLLCAVVVMLCFSGTVSRLNMVGFIVELSRAMPDVIAGYGVISSPFGGVFRFDFAVVAAILFLLDYACARASRALR